MPLSTDDSYAFKLTPAPDMPKVKPGERVKITSEPMFPFICDRLHIGGPSMHDFTIHAIVVDGHPMIARPHHGTEILNKGGLSFRRLCTRRLEIELEYTGTIAEGAHFYGSVVGEWP